MRTQGLIMTNVTHPRMALVVLLFCTIVLLGCGGGGGGNNNNELLNSNENPVNTGPRVDDDRTDNGDDGPDNGNGDPGNNEDSAGNDVAVPGNDDDAPGNDFDGPGTDDDSSYGSEKDEPTHYMPESEFPGRIDLESPLAIPLSGSVGGGNYTLEYAYPALEETLVAPVAMTHDGVTDRIFVVGMTGIIYVFPNDHDVQPSQVSTF